MAGKVQRLRTLIPRVRPALETEHQKQRQEWQAWEASGLRGTKFGRPQGLDLSPSLAICNQYVPRNPGHR